MSDLVDFLLARIAEDEEAASTLLADYGTVTGWMADDHAGFDLDVALDLTPWLSRFDPARVLAESQAKRSVLALLNVAEEHAKETRRTAPDLRAIDAADGPHEALEYAVRHLALPYAGHPNYRVTWRP